MANTASAKKTGFGRRLLRWTVNLVWITALTLLVLLALYIGLGRQVMGNLHHFQDEIENELAALVGQPVRINAIRGGWRGLDPVLNVHGLEILTPEGDEVAASLGQMRIRVDSRVSAQRMRLVFREFAMRDALLIVAQEEDGRLSIHGLWEPADEALDEPRAMVSEAVGDFERLLAGWIDDLGALLSEPAVEIEDTRLGLAVAGEPVRYFDIPRMDMRFEQGIFQASGHATRADEEEQVARFVIRGQHFFSGHFTGQAFLDLSSGRLFDALLRRYDWQNLSVEGIEANARGWFEFDDGRPQSAVADLDAPFLQLQSHGRLLDPIEDLRVRSGWVREADGWRASLSGLSYRWGGSESPPVSAELERSGELLQLRIDEVETGPLARLMRATEILPRRAHEELANFAPEGAVRRLDLLIEDDGPWRLRADFHDVSVQSHAGAPEASGLSGYIDMDGQQGQVRLRPGAVRLGFPDFYSGSWDFPRLGGGVQWRFSDSGLVVTSHDLVARYGDQARINGAFRAHFRPDEEDMLSLRVGVADGDTGMVPDLVPDRLLPEGLYHYLSERIGEGALAEGWYYGHGSIQPGQEERSFTSSYRYRFEDAELRYHDDWPLLRGASGEVRGHNASASIELERGEVGNVAVDPSSVRVDPVPEGVRVDLRTGAHRVGQVLPDIWREQSPLPEILGEWINDLSLDGPAQIGLRVGLIPGSEQPPDIEFNLRSEGGRLRYLPADLVWEDIDGALSFDSDSGFSAEGLSARFLDEPVQVTVADPAEGALEVTQKGRFSVAALEEMVGWPLPRLSGSSDYAARLSPQKGPVLRIEASMDAIQSTWPEPLSVSAEDEQGATVEADFSQEGAISVGGHWNPLFAFRFRLQDGGFERGNIVLAQESAQLPDAPGLRVTGSVPRLDLNQWNDAMGDWPADVHQPPEKADGVGFRPQLDLLIENLRAMERSFGRTRLGVAPTDEGGWEVFLEGERVDGEIAMPASEDDPVQVHFRRFSTPPLDAAADDAGADERHGATLEEMEEWPPLDIRIDELEIAGRSYGRWEFQVRSSSQRLAFSEMRGEFGDLLVSGEIVCEPDDEGRLRSRLEGQLSGGSIKGLEDLLEQGVPLRSDSTEVALDLSWPGMPREFTMATASGAIDFRFADGTIEEEGDAAQLFRVFGLLNTDTVWRRLRLDFSDVYEAGIPFEEIEGRAVLHDARLTLDPEVVIRAPSGGFRMSGQADLADETLDMRLVVVLPVTQNLPLAAVLFGAAPPIGGALFVVDRLFGGMLSRVTSATYNIEGTWDEPEVSLRNLFDTESDLRGYERPDIVEDDQ